MIYICDSFESDHSYFFMDVPDDVDFKFPFLYKHFRASGKINNGNIINDCVDKINLLTNFNYIYNVYITYSKKDYLYEKLSIIPKDFLQYLISEWKKDPNKIYASKFEQEIDSIYDDLIIKDIIE